MSIGRNREEQELTQRLAQGLVQKEVMEPMEKIGWGHSAPPPPDYSGQPAPAEGAPGQAAAPALAPAPGQPGKPVVAAPAQAGASKADTPTSEQLVASFEALRDPETGLIEGKYKTVEEAMKGRVHLNQMANKAFSERDEALRQLAEIQNGTLTVRQAPAAAPAAAAPQPKPVDAPSRARLDSAQANYDKVLSEITENGGVLDAETSKALSRAQREVAEAAADVRVEEKFAAQANQENANKAEWDRVDDYMSQKHPAAARFSEEVALNLRSDPLLASAVNALLAQGNRIGATELAWVSFERAHGEQVKATERVKAEDQEADLAAREKVRQEHVEKARRDAGVIQGSAGGAGVHEHTQAGNSREEIAAAREAMAREGDAPGSPAAMRFRQMVIGPSLDPAIFGPR